MRKVYSIIFILPFLFFGISSMAAVKDLDSLRITYDSAEEGTKEKAMASIKLADKFRGANIDSSNLYLQQAQDLAEKLDDDYLRGEALLVKGLLELFQGKYEDVVNYSNQAKKYFVNVDDSIGIAKSYANLGLAYDYWGKYEYAIEYYFKSLMLMERLEKWEGVVSGNINVGVVYYIQGNYEKSLEFYLQAQTEAEKHHIVEFNSMIFNNIALIGEQIEDYDLVLEYYKKALDYSKKANDLSPLATVLSNLSLTYQRLGELDTAMACLNEAEVYAKQLGDKQSLSFVYRRKGVIERVRKNYNQALNYLFKAKEIATEIGALVQLEKAYESITETYYDMGEYKLALENVLLAKSSSDSIMNEKNQAQMAELDIKYNTEKKENEITMLKQSSDIQKMELEKNQMMIWGAVAGILFMLVVVLITLNSYKQKSKANKEIVHQKEIIEEAHQEITDSITYAKRIQSAILPPDKVVKEFLQESFILYKPKDIVAGDFYWLEQREDKILFAAADCTGHGVPGAMVSVVCHNALNRSVKEYGLTNPGEILDRTRDIVIQEFDKSDEEVNDGMDIALCSLNKNHLEYAGANNPLWIVREGSIIETKADKQPIGKFDNPKPYSTHTFELQKGDSIYIFSDGFVDQFGGEKGKKFKAKGFRELLVSIQDKSMEEQKVLIDKIFENWRGELDQIDDVCVIGVRV